MGSNRLGEGGSVYAGGCIITKSVVLLEKYNVVEEQENTGDGCGPDELYLMETHVETSLSWDCMALCYKRKKAEGSDEKGQERRGEGAGDFSSEDWKGVQRGEGPTLELSGDRMTVANQLNGTSHCGDTHKNKTRNAQKK